MLFHSRIKDVGGFKSDFTQEQIKNEPMFFNSDLSFVFQNGGPITRAFVDSLPWAWIGPDKPLVFDSRVHMLMPGWFPCIPGYHHDDVPRSTKTGQPNYKNPEYFSHHLVGLVNGEICPTEFIVDDVEVSDPDESGIIYKKWHKEIETMDLQKVSAPSGRYIQFDADTFHTGVRANAGGWRWFMRVSCNTDRTNHITNEIRRQVQVYLEFPMEGW